MKDRAELFVGLAVLVCVGVGLWMGSSKHLMISTSTVTSAMKDSPKDAPKEVAVEMTAKKPTALDELRRARKMAKETAMQAAIGLPAPSTTTIKR